MGDLNLATAELNDAAAEYWLDLDAELERVGAEEAHDSFELELPEGFDPFADA